MEFAQVQMKIYVHKCGSQCNSPSRKNLRYQHNIAHDPRPDESFENCRACRGREELQAALHLGIVEPRTCVVIVCPRLRPPRLCPRRCLPNGTKLRPPRCAMGPAVFPPTIPSSTLPLACASDVVAAVVDRRVLLSKL